MQGFVVLSLWPSKAWPAHSSSLALGRSALAPRPQSPFREEAMQGFVVLSLWPSKYSLPIRPVSHTTEAPSPLVLKAPFERKRRNASRFFRYGCQSMACPFVQSRTWQERPRPSSSKPLSRGYDAELRGSFVMAGKAWPAHSSSLALGRSALAPRPQSAFREEAPQGFAVLSPRPPPKKRETIE